MAEKKAPINPVTPADPRAPMFIVFRQTPARDIYKRVAGDASLPNNGRGAVDEIAKRWALDYKCPVFVFGPQAMVYMPPAPVEPQAVGFAFNEMPEDFPKML